MAVVCVDAQIVIWGVKGEASPERAHMITQAQAFFADLDKQKIRVAIPAVVVGELLLNVDAARHHELVEILARRFLIIPYDTRAAANFARLWRAHTAAATIQDIVDERRSTKTQLRADTMIVATAIACNAQCLYSEDKDIEDLSKDFIRHERISNLMLQQTLFTP